MRAKTVNIFIRNGRIVRDRIMTFKRINLVGYRKARNGVNHKWIKLLHKRLETMPDECKKVYEK